ncbi:MAG: DNA mismatch repair protein MutS, partial [Clostridia bacterium]|nr:DNA mismatch repair protein MutS [Clostridia bacterium]
MEDPSTAKGLVRRDIVRIVTPGTVMESSMLDESSNNFICTVFTQKNKTGLSFCDISTGELYATLVEGDGQENRIKDELLKFSPKEILIGGDAVKFKTLAMFIKDKLTASVSMLDDDEFSYADSSKVILKQFKKEDLSELGLSEINQTVSALGALLVYLKRTQINGLERISHVEIYKENQYLHIDYNTRRNLELTEPLNSKNKSASLLAVLDKTKTSMGSRLIKSYIEKPLVNMAQIIKRQNGVTELYENVMMRTDLREALVGITDIQRIITRVVYGSANARELRSMCGAMQRLPAVKKIAENAQSAILKNMYSDLDDLQDLCKLIDNAIVEEPPQTIKEGGMIKEGFNKELDEIRYDMDHSSSILAGIETRERENTGIPKLKIGYNRVFGYYIEVSNSYKDKVPESYIRKQTLTNGERFITQELKELEQRILGAKDRSCDLEYAIFDSIRITVAKSLERINKTANAVATLDVIASLAQAAFENNYCCPTLTADGVIKLTESRHPVVERLAIETRFVPNDVYLDSDENRVAIVTGPNMAGKSTYMRQVALIVLMAQIGSYVPAKYAQISITDSI